MEAKTTRFVTQFSRAVFQQWTQTPEREQFWKDGAFLHSMLEEAVAKLPREKLKAQLARDLKPLETQLASLLRELHAEHVQKQTLQQESLAHGALLNEELTELELTQAATADKQRRLAGVLALDAGVDIAQHASALEQEQDVEQLVQLFALIAARNYESPRDQKHKRGLVLQRLAACAQKQLETLPSNWSCDGESDAGKQVLQLRALLERVVVQDAVALASEEGDVVAAGQLQAPWTKFYCPEKSKELKKVSYDDEVAKIYGLLLALAVYFPIESEDEEDTSDESASSEDEEANTSTQQTQKQKPLGAVAQAQLATRQTLLAAQLRQQSGQWLVSVLTFLQVLPKPTTYLDEDEDEALDAEDRRTLLDCIGHVYTRAFASVALFEQGKENIAEEKAAVQDRALFEAVVCLRHAAHFMRVERKSSLPAVTTAMAHLAGVPLPFSFTTWLDLEQTAAPKSVLEKATQRLWKKCTDDNKMINILLSSTDVTAEELPLVQKSYLEYLERVAEGNVAKPSHTADAEPSSSGAAAEEPTVDPSNLFYVDNAGGDVKETASKSKKRRANKKKRANKSNEASPSKRSRTSSS
ncbi:hypothetical protein PR003_g9859 [Phytophthora rubi]|uniref:Uncharacterized protein n=1 Tax=Phytophthora rubi TaxID=129364 RepID=A0A6A4FSZ8_9STRA|nr:hypothetical protein PR002_g9617 [Phytophthora rubi]KAE9341687.1 hypothetical protein PR003_g9859 [Phytophthora rubi]